MQKADRLRSFTPGISADPEVYRISDDCSKPDNKKQNPDIKDPVPARALNTKRSESPGRNGVTTSPVSQKDDEKEDGIDEES